MTHPAPREPPSSTDEGLLVGLPSPLLAAALNAAQLGALVIPIKPGGKTPLTKHGLKDGTTDPAIIRAWWGKWPNANLGVVTGEASGIFVLDIDGEAGEAALADLEGQYGRLPRTRESLTGGGGRHLFFQHPGYRVANVQNGKIGAGLDVRGDGGYIVAPPSVHESGKRYRFRGNPAAEILEAPEWFLDLLKPPIKQPSEEASSEFADDRRVAKGERHQALVSFAGKLRYVGATQTEILDALTAFNYSRCDPPKSPATIKKIAGDIANRYPKGAGDPTEWVELRPLPQRAPVLPCDLEMLPAVIGEWAEDLANRAQVPIDLPVAAVIVCLAGAVGRRARVQPKQFDTSFIVIPNLWGVIVAEPGSKKTFVISEAKKQLRRIDERMRRQFEEATQRFEREPRQSAGEGESADVHLPRPRRRRVLINDATAEALHVLLATNPGGLLVLRDELTGWLAALDKRGREGDRGFFLEAWSGDGAYRSARISRGSTDSDALCVSLLGGVQPGPWTRYVERAPDDGLLQRFQVLVWPDPVPRVRVIDRAPNLEAERRITAIFDSLVEMPVDEPRRLRFSAAAQELHDAWLLELEETILRNTPQAALANHRAKYRSLMPSIACIFELVRNESAQDISLRSARRAAAFCEYLDSHAVRSYSARSESGMEAARTLTSKLTSGTIGGSGQFSLREVYRSGWRGLTNAAEARAACATLIEYGWIRRAPLAPGTGRPSEIFEINPEALP